MSLGSYWPLGQLGRAGRVELVGGGQRERPDVLPVRGQGPLERVVSLRRRRRAVGARRRRIGRVGLDPGGGQDAERLPAPGHGRLVPVRGRLVGARGGSVATGLVGAVVGAVGDDRVGGPGADLGRDRGGGAVGGEAIGDHLALEVGLLAGRVGRVDEGIANGVLEQVLQHPEGGVADRLLLVGLGPLADRLAEVAVGQGRDGGAVIGGPGVVGGGVEHRDGPRGDGRAGRAGVQPDGLEQLLVPGQDGVVGERVGREAVDRPAGVRGVRGRLRRAGRGEDREGGHDQGRGQHQGRRQLPLHMRQPFSSAAGVWQQGIIRRGIGRTTGTR